MRRRLAVAIATALPVRRAFAAIEEEAAAAWMRRHLDHCLEPLLSERWILDMDTTVKPLYKIVADDEGRVTFEIERVATDGKTGKPVADITRYTYGDGDRRYVVTFERQKTILQAIFTERAPFIKRVIAKIVAFDGAYHRFTGKVTIEKFEKDVRAEIFEDQAIWELMYFGKAQKVKTSV